MHTMTHTSPCQRPNQPLPDDQYDDDCPSFPQIPEPLGLQHASLWDEAIARIRASKSPRRASV
jgi:NADPH-dependent glutamate synthase beta subunit-like oxidoreductase